VPCLDNPTSPRLKDNLRERAIDQRELRWPMTDVNVIQDRIRSASENGVEGLGVREVFGIV